MVFLSLGLESFVIRAYIANISIQFCFIPSRIRELEVIEYSISVFLLPVVIYLQLTVVEAMREDLEYGYSRIFLFFCLKSHMKFSKKQFSTVLIQENNLLVKIANTHIFIYLLFYVVKK